MKNNELTNQNDYVSKKEFKKAVRNMNLLLFALAICVLYIYFCKQVNFVDIDFFNELVDGICCYAMCCLTIGLSCCIAIKLVRRILYDLDDCFWSGPDKEDKIKKDKQKEEDYFSKKQEVIL